MAVELKKLYEEIRYKYNVHLETESCFDKQISWLHILDNMEFAPFLHGDELVFNSSLNEAAKEVRKQYIDQLILSKAGGLIVSLQQDREFSSELIQYCNDKRFPVFTTGWDTPFINITRIFSEILIDNERAEMDLIAALKNALNHPEDCDSYISHFVENHFPMEDEYVISIVGHHGEDSTQFSSDAARIAKSLSTLFDHSVHYIEGKIMIVLTRGYSEISIHNSFLPLAKRFPNICFSVGSAEKTLANLHNSYHNAKQTFHLSNRVFSTNLICYKDIGAYQVLADMKNPETICPAFIQRTLGKLISYDQENRTKYMDILRDFFANDCSITQTSAATFFHQNTLKYKIKNIKEILGYDIMTNENRVKIMLALYMLDLT